jgi:DNA-binding transcriptional LysR family regulator
MILTPRVGGFEALADDLRRGRIDLAVTYDLDLDAGFDRRAIARLAPRAVLGPGHMRALSAAEDLAALIAAEPLLQ